jgi:hypothetical protein
VGAKESFSDDAPRVPWFDSDNHRRTSSDFVTPFEVFASRAGPLDCCWSFWECGGCGIEGEAHPVWECMGANSRSWESFGKISLRCHGIRRGFRFVCKWRLAYGNCASAVGGPLEFVSVGEAGGVVARASFLWIAISGPTVICYSCFRHRCKN